MKNIYFKDTTYDELPKFILESDAVPFAVIETSTGLRIFFYIETPE